MRCDYCGALQSEGVQRCSGCGKAMQSRAKKISAPSRPPSLLKIGAACGALLLLAMFWRLRSAGDNPMPASSPVKVASMAPIATPRPIPVSASQLLNDYEANPAAAESTYAGRPLQITGVIQTKGRDKAGRAFVKLQTAGGKALTCYLRPSHDQLLPLLKERAEFSGRCVASTAGKSVTAEECEY